MHIKLLYRKVLYVFLSLAIVFANIQTAYSASPVGWSASPADIIMNGATATVTAIKGAGSRALQSTVNHAPTVGNIGKKILKGAGGVAVAYAVTELIGAGVDWVLDPANNRIKYGGEGTCQGTGWYAYGFEKEIGFHSSPNGACRAMNAKYAPSKPWDVTGGNQCNFGAGGKTLSFAGVCDASNPTYNPTSEPKYIPISTVAQKVQSNAAAGHAPSQELIKTVVIDDINAGVLDAPLNTNAVPVADAPPVNPPHDPTQPAPPFDPSSIIAAIKSVMAAVVNMSGVLSAKIDALMIDLGLKQAETIEAITAGTGEIVAANDRTGAKVAEMVAAIEAIEGNTMDGQLINDAIDRVIANDNAKVGDIVAAIEAIEGNTLDGQVINDAIDRVIANDNANAQSAADAANTAAEAAKAADAANTAAVTDAIGAQTDAMTTTDPTTGEKSLKLPAFCGFAPVVCDYITWVKGEYQTVTDWVKAEPETMPDDPVVVADDPSGIGNIFQDKAEAGYVSFESQCPNDVLIPVSLMGASQTLTISYTPFCHFASLIRYAVILGAWISGLLIVTGGRSRE